MVTLQTADNVLKSFYLDAVKEGINLNTNPLLAMVKSTSANVVGKDVKKAVRVGINGGIGAGSETGDLPKSGENRYKTFTSTLKNLYGTIEISDKAIRASASDEGAFVNLLNDEMQGLIKSASFNFGRMLFGDGSGIISKVKDINANTVKVEKTSFFVEGMVISFCTANQDPIEGALNRKIVAVNSQEQTIVVDGSPMSTELVPVGSGIYVQGSLGAEITGLEAIFSDNAIYGQERDCRVMKPYIREDVGELNESLMHLAIDEIEEASGSKVDLILCTPGVKRALVQYYEARKMFLPSKEINGGYKALDFCGIPVVADRFCPKHTMYFLNTESFKLHQLCDWQWLEGEDGKILKQVPGKPVYTATLVKYAELMCENPCAQGKLAGVDEY